MDKKTERGLLARLQALRNNTDDIWEFAQSSPESHIGTTETSYWGLTTGPDDKELPEKPSPPAED